ncbi:MAG: hypothetical protein OXK82_07865 [Deltaproteobacteria bacterium]|nr:hypothetical protein [Deltaproteobacteria bacterium]
MTEIGLNQAVALKEVTWGCVGQTHRRLAVLVNTVTVALRPYALMSFGYRLQKVALMTPAASAVSGSSDLLRAIPAFIQYRSC